MNLDIEHDLEDIENTEYFKNIKKHEKEIKKCIELCLKEEKIETNNTIEIYIRYTNNKEIKKVNNEYRNIDKETDVLSFPMYESNEIMNICQEDINIKALGDIVISIEKVEMQAQEYGHTFLRELIYLITHAMFHLLGYDHMTEKEKKIMREKEEKIMNKLDIKR